MANLLSTNVTGTINSTGNTTAAGFTGNANVGGTGAATWHPSGIYSGGTQWLYGTTYRNNASTSGQGQMYFDGNYGYGMVGLYSDVRYQAIFAMGDSYKLPVNGATTGSLYGIAWTHTNIGGESKAGLGHQALFMMNGRTYTAIGSGIWTDGTITTTSHGTSANWNTAYGWGNHASAGYQAAATAITTSNIGSQSVNYAASAGSVAWTNVSSRPTALSQFTNDLGNYGGWLTTSGKAADSELIDGIDSTRIVYGGGASKVSSHSNANDRRDSGFYENEGGGSNWPSATWYNSINVRHSNQGNYHGFQVAMSYYDNNLWFRSYQGDGTFQSWVYAISSANIGSQSVNYAASAGNADTLDGYHGSNYLGKNGNSYYQQDTWIQVNGTHGLYWPAYYDAHFSANDLSSYTQFALRGSKNSYGGFYDNYSRVNGAMYDSGGNGGVYREANGLWYWYYHVGNNSMGIGSSANSSSYVVYASGSIYATGDIVAYSDRRKKTDIVTIDSALDKVMAMRGVFYTKIDESEKGRQVGVIAQEVNEILPEAVTYAADVDEYGVKYGNIVGVLIEAIKEQQKQIEEQNKRIAFLEAS